MEFPFHYVGVYTSAASKLLERFKQEFAARVQMLGSTNGSTVTAAPRKPGKYRAALAITSQLPADKALLTVTEAQSVLHVSSRSTIYRWLNEGRLERASLARRAGTRGKVLIKRESIDRLLEQDSE
jgi:excisionase family DNA binding protein